MGFRDCHCMEKGQREEKELAFIVPHAELQRHALKGKVSLLLSALICKELQSYSHRETLDHNMLSRFAASRVLISN